jgi:hypothetical protein
MYSYRALFAWSSSTDMSAPSCTNSSTVQYFEIYVFYLPTPYKQFLQSFLPITDISTGLPVLYVV